MTLIIERPQQAAGTIIPQDISRMWAAPIEVGRVPMVAIARVVLPEHEGHVVAILSEEWTFMTEMRFQQMFGYQLDSRLAVGEVGLSSLRTCGGLEMAVPRTTNEMNVCLRAVGFNTVK